MRYLNCVADQLQPEAEQPVQYPGRRSALRNDDLPYFVQVGDKRHLVLPYAFDTNDMQFFHTNRFSGAADFAAYVIDAFDWLYCEGAHAPKMMSIGLHLRIIGRPGRIGALNRSLRHIADRGDAWIARRVDIANHWLAQFP